MEAIWKFPLAIADEQIVDIPLGFEALCVQSQAGQICLWCKVNTERHLDQVAVNIYGTGHQHTAIKGTYVGTVQMGPLVWHVFYRRVNAPV